MLSGEVIHLETLAEVDNWLLDQARPDIFDTGDPRNVLVAQARQFGQLCAALADNGFARAHELTLFDFHTAIDYVAEKHKPRT